MLLLSALVAVVSAYTHFWPQKISLSRVLREPLFPKVLYPPAYVLCAEAGGGGGLGHFKTLSTFLTMRLPSTPPLPLRKISSLASARGNRALSQYLLSLRMHGKSRALYAKLGNGHYVCVLLALISLSLSDPYPYSLSAFGIFAGITNRQKEQTNKQTHIKLHE